jgi:hypothetical protein
LIIGPAVIIVDVIALDVEGGFVGIAEGQARINGDSNFAL